MADGCSRFVVRTLVRCLEGYGFGSFLFFSSVDGFGMLALGTSTCCGGFFCVF